MSSPAKKKSKKTPSLKAKSNSIQLLIEAANSLDRVENKSWEVDAFVPTMYGTEVPVPPSPILSVTDVSLEAWARAPKDMQRSVFSPGKIYEMRTIRVATLVSSGAGALNTATAVYPSQMSSYSALAALFKEARLIMTRIHYVMCIGSTSPVGMATSFDPSSDGTVPTNVTAALQIVGSKLLSIWNTAAVGSLSNSYTVRGNRPWSLTTASPTGTDPLGGVVGAWNHSVISPVSNTSNVATYFIECKYEFRNPL
jgi:hypothetical protein